jgi:hypothetical protein
MKVVRKITYEIPEGKIYRDPEEVLKKQISMSLGVGLHKLAVDITVEHLEGPDFSSERKGWYEPRLEAEVKGAGE